MLIPMKSSGDPHHDLVECPTCHREVDAKLQICPYCGTLMSSKTTIVIPDKPKTGMTHIQQVSQLIKEHSNAMILYLSEHNQNVILKTDGGIILGRATPEESEGPLLDLVPFGAQKKGVSRHHAEIRYLEDEKEYVIKDLNSTNGTFVNEVKLTPHVPVRLANGNTIRLGQMLLFAYFSTGSSALERSETEPVVLNTLDPTIMLSERVEVSSDAPLRRLTPQYIHTTLLPYLDAIFASQDVYHTVKGNRLVKPGITSITMAENHVISVKVKDCNEIIRFIAERVMPWRKQHADRLIMWHDRLSDDPSGDPELLSNALVQLGRELLQFATGDLTINHDPDLIEGLMPHLRVLTLSKLDLTI